MIRPIGDKVLIKQTTADTMFGHIVLPDCGKEKPDEGDVLDTGDKYTGPLKPGDHILYAQYAGDTIVVGEGPEKKEYVILRDGDVLAVLEE